MQEKNWSHEIREELREALPGATISDIENGYKLSLGMTWIKYEKQSRADLIWIGFTDGSLTPVFSDYQENAWVYTDSRHYRSNDWVVRQGESACSVLGSPARFILARFREYQKKYADMTEINSYTIAKLAASIRTEKFDKLFDKLLSHHEVKNRIWFSALGSIALQHGYSREEVDRKFEQLLLAIAASQVLVR